MQLVCREGNAIEGDGLRIAVVEDGVGERDTVPVRSAHAARLDPVPATGIDAYGMSLVWRGCNRGDSAPSDIS